MHLFRKETKNHEYHKLVHTISIHLPEKPVINEE